MFHKLFPPKHFYPKLHNVCRRKSRSFSTRQHRQRQLWQPRNKHTLQPPQQFHQQHSERAPARPGGSDTNTIITTTNHTTPTCPPYTRRNDGRIRTSRKHEPSGGHEQQAQEEGTEKQSNSGEGGRRAFEHGGRRAGIDVFTTVKRSLLTSTAEWKFNTLRLCLYLILRIYSDGCGSSEHFFNILAEDVRPSSEGVLAPTMPPGVARPRHNKRQRVVLKTRRRRVSSKERCSIRSRMIFLW